MLLSALMAARLSAGAFEPGVLMFLLTLLAMQVRPELANRPLRPSAVDDAGPIAQRALMALGAVAVVTVITGVGRLEPVLLLGAVVPPAVIGGRAASYAIARRLRSAQPSRTLIVGAGDVARRLIGALEERKDYGMEVVGALDDSPKLSDEELGSRVLGRIKDLPAVARSHRVENVIVAFSSQREADTLRAIRSAVGEGVHVWIVPRFFELGGCPQTSEHLWGYPMFKVSTPADARPEWALKWMLDKVGSAFGLIIAAPFFALIAAAVLFESGRPLFFRQERLGKGGGRFDLLKFRTMRVCDDVTNKTEWSADEHRITRSGAFLRKTGLDELPQLLNVLKGDMSLVGPRPERPFFVERFSGEFPTYEERHRVPVGVTGWSQIHGLRGDTSIEDRAALDNYYVDNWSFGQDLKIIVKTIPTLFGNQEVDRGQQDHRQDDRDFVRQPGGGPMMTFRPKARLALTLVAGALGLMMLFVPAATAQMQDPYGNGKPTILPTRITHEGEPEGDVFTDVQSGSGEVSGSSDEQPGPLPFTGGQVSLFVIVAFGLMATGTLIVRRVRARAPGGGSSH